jgi:hypothetical protein
MNLNMKFLLLLFAFSFCCMLGYSQDTIKPLAEVKISSFE